MPPYGAQWQEDFRKSGSKVMTKLADLMHIGPSHMEALQHATKTK